MAAADLDAALGASERILLDSSALIAFHSPHESVHPLAVHLLQRVERGDDPLRGYYSAVSAAELLARPIRSSVQAFAFVYAFLSGFPNLSLLPMDLAVAVEAATVRARSGLRLPDAIVVASGLSSGCQAIVSNDAQWKRQLAPMFPGLHWVYLGDYE